MKKTTIFIALIISASLCFYGKAIAVPKNGKKHVTMESDANRRARENDSLRQVIQSYQQQTPPGQGPSERDYRAVVFNYNQAVLGQKELNEQIQRDRKTQDSLAKLIVYPSYKIGTETLSDIDLPLIDYRTCDTTKCTPGVGIKEFLAQVTLFTKSDVKQGAPSLVQYSEFVQAINRLSIQAAADEYAAVSVYYKMLGNSRSGDNDRIDQKSQRKMLQITLLLLDTRMNYILNAPSEWKKANMTKKQVQSIFSAAHRL